MIYVKKYNNTFYEIICNNNSELRKIKNFFTYTKLIFQNRKPKHIRICLLYKDRFLPCGLINELFEFIDDVNIEYNVHPDFLERNNINKETLYKSWDMFNLVYDPTDYQKEAVYTCLRDKRKLVLSLTSSGKSLMIFLMCMSYLSMKNDNKKIVIIVPSITLVNQMYFDFKDYLRNSNIDISKYVDRKGGGNKSEFTKNILITTWQSLQKEKTPFLRQFGMTIVDEVHGAAAVVLQNLIRQIGSEYKIGLTGTLTNDDDILSEKTIKGLFGDIHVATTYNELLDLEFITPMQIRSIKLNHGRMNKMSYIDEKKYICDSTQRLKFITDLVKNVNGNTLILFKTIEHGRKILESISKHKNVFYIDGSISGKDREDIRQKMNHVDNYVLVASYKTVGTGFSVNKIHNVVFVESIKSKITAIQSIGRGLRKHETKDQVIIYDIADYIKYEYTESYTWKHYEHRKSYYIDYGYPFKEVEIKLN